MFVYTTNQKDIEILTQRECPLMNVLEDGTHIFCLDYSTDVNVGFSCQELEDSVVTDTYHF